MNDSPFIDIDDRIRLLGTAHVAQKSVDAVAFHVTEFQPTTVAVELCESRKEALTQQRRLDKESLLKVIKEGKAPLVLIQSLLAAEQRKIGMNEGVQPGEELLKAVQVAEEHELPVALVDRDIQTTLRRAWKNMGFREKISLFSALIFDEEEEEIDLNEVLSDQDLLSSLMLELKEISPGAGEVLVDERDEYIARKIASIDSEQKVLAVLGAGHLEGVAKYLKEGFSNEENRLEVLDTIPKKTFFAKSFPWLIPMALFGVMAWFSHKETSMQFGKRGHLARIKCPRCRIMLCARRRASSFHSHGSLSKPNHISQSNACCGMVCGLCADENQRTDSRRFATFPKT